MRKIAIACGFCLVLLFAVVGCLTIFDVLSIDAAREALFEFGAAIALLGICAALLTVLAGRSRR